MSKEANVFDNLRFHESAKQCIREIAQMLGETRVTHAVVVRVLQKALSDERYIMEVRTRKETLFVGTSRMNASEIVWPPGR